MKQRITWNLAIEDARGIQKILDKTEYRLVAARMERIIANSDKKYVPISKNTEKSKVQAK